ncbi:MAG: AAA-like domain-containing protein [Chloroflexota bacterium]
MKVGSLQFLPPRQAGKTTYFQLLFRTLETKGYTPIWVSFESFRNISREDFYETFDIELKEELGLFDIDIDAPINSHISLQSFFRKLRSQSKKVVLVIDEFEDTPKAVMSELLHAFRKMYHRKQFYALHAMMLVGVSTLVEQIVSASSEWSSSPFNVSDELKIAYFTFAETESLLLQYVQDSDQKFDPAVINAIHENTQGQPGLVCALAAHLIEEKPDRTQPITLKDFYKTLKHFLTERLDKNILNIVQKAKAKKDFMLRLLFEDTPIPFTVDTPDIAYLAAHGVIHNVDGYVEIPVPLYSKRLITAFRPHINGEARHYITTAKESMSDYVTADGLDLHAMLQKYRAYVRRRGFRAFDTKQLKEGAWHYSLDGFINFAIQGLGGDTLIEVPSGRGRTDIFITYQGKKYIIETKIYTQDSYFKHGKYQLADYLEAEQLDEGHYVVFSNVHDADDELDFDEQMDGKRIRTMIVRTNFDRSSDKKSPPESKSNDGA